LFGLLLTLARVKGLVPNPKWEENEEEGGVSKAEGGECE